MSARLTRALPRAPARILLISLIAAIGAAAYAISVPDGLAIGGGMVSGSESDRARERLASELGSTPVPPLC